jgi:hypothetical protein
MHREVCRCCCCVSQTKIECTRSGGRTHLELPPVTPEIKTDKPSLLLRLLREEDAEELSLRVDQNHAHLRRWTSWVDGTTTTSATLKFIRSCLESAVWETGFHYALLLDGEIMGLVIFNSIEKINRCATMGYWLAFRRLIQNVWTIQNQLQKRNFVLRKGRF